MALVMQGQGDEGLDQMRQSLTAYEATGAAIWRPYFLALLAEAYGQVGAADEGLRVLAAVARRQQAKSLELRAATSLAQLWQQHGARVP